MIHLISQGNKKAEAIVVEPNGNRKTVHLLFDGEKWTDNFGAKYNLQSKSVDFTQFYRLRLQKVLYSNPDKAYEMARNLTRSVRLTNPELFEQTIELDSVVNKVA